MKAILLAAAAMPMILAAEWNGGTVAHTRKAWSPTAAAGYLGGRADSAPCLSCHTTFPYALARPYLSGQKLTGADKKLFESITDRVNRWADVQPYFTDKNSNPEQIRNARGGESVLNALVLLQRDRPSNTLNPDTKKALDLMWDLQIKSGDKAGAWPWFRLGNEPWEADDSQYWGTTMVGLVVAWAPKSYVDSPVVQANLGQARSYLRQEFSRESLLNQANALWIDGTTTLLTVEQRKQVADELLAQQHADGGWSATSLAISGLRRHDGTPQDTESDGYATALAVLALQKTPTARHAITEGRAWLLQHQRSDGAWAATSLNAKRDPSSDVGHFMTDAATAYAVIALTTTASR